MLNFGKLSDWDHELRYQSQRQYPGFLQTDQTESFEAIANPWKSLISVT